MALHSTEGVGNRWELSSPHVWLTDIQLFQKVTYLWIKNYIVFFYSQLTTLHLSACNHICRLYSTNIFISFSYTNAQHTLSMNYRLPLFYKCFVKYFETLTKKRMLYPLKNLLLISLRKYYDWYIFLGFYLVRIKWEENEKTSK